MGFCEHSQGTVLQGADQVQAQEGREDHGHVQGEAELPLRQRGSHQQADQHGAICLLRLSLHVFSKRFKEASTEERDHAMKLIDYQTMRGGRVVFREIAKPSMDEWGTALEAVEATLELEKTVNESLLVMHKTADDHGDAQMTDFLEGNYLEEQVEAIKEIADLVTKMKRAGDGLGLHIIDKELQS